MNRQSYRRWMGGLLIYTLLVILWGAWVRISHSGDGCGDHWPLCQGELFPNEGNYKTWIEYSHRAMSGVYGILVLWLWWIGLRVFPTKDSTRRAIHMVLGFTISEALLGAVLVKAGLVGQEDSPWRAFVMALHLLNSLVLVASVAWVWDGAREQSWRVREKFGFGWTFFRAKAALWGVGGVFILLCCTGAVAALATTLFPFSSLQESLQAEFAEGAHYLLRLRGIHPILGLILGGGLAVLSHIAASGLDEQYLDLQGRLRQLSFALTAGVLVGMITLFLLSPVFLKLIHLLVTYWVWVALVLAARTLLFQVNPLPKNL